MKSSHKITITLDGKPSRKLTEAILESWDYSKIANVEYRNFRQLTNYFYIVYKNNDPTQNQSVIEAKFI